MTETAGGEKVPFIPYVEELPHLLEPIVGPYKERMGFLPNALKFYMHRPEIAETLFTLNNTVMRDPSSTLDQNLKRRLATVASKLNGCTYCTSHHCNILLSPEGGGAEGWGMTETEVQDMLTGELAPQNDFERVCFDFVKAASQDPANVPDEVRQALTEHLTPAQIVELAAVVGFWKLYNTIHDALDIPIEAHLHQYMGFVDL
jgi:uncharacterized peroxidase-related enzyme